MTRSERLRRLIPILGGLCLAACAGAPVVTFHGRPLAPVVAPDQVVEAPALPQGAERLGTLVVRCDSDRSWEPFEARRLSDLDCTPARLGRMLREAASERGGDVLVGTLCETGSLSGCRATLARRSHRGAGRAIDQAPPDVRSALGAEIRVGFSPSVVDPGLSERTEDEVNEVGLGPPSHVVVGTLATECEVGCEELDARDALRIAAGRLGVTDVAQVRCFRWGDGYRCTGRALLAENALGRRSRE